MRALSIAVLSVSLSCGPSGGWVVIDVDCGTAVEPLSVYEAAGRDCVWDAYSQGRSLKWVVTRQTIEGDAIPRTLTVASGSIQATLDNRPDRYGGQDRGVQTWRCSSIAKHTVSSDGSRYDFYLSGCSGPGASMTFP